MSAAWFCFGCLVGAWVGPRLAETWHILWTAYRWRRNVLPVGARPFAEHHELCNLNMFRKSTGCDCDFRAAPPRKER